MARQKTRLSFKKLSKKQAKAKGKPKFKKDATVTDTITTSILEASDGSPNEIVNKIRNAKTGKGRRVLKDREPKIIENRRTLMILKGNKVSSQLMSLLTDLSIMSKPHCIFLQRKKFRDLHLFDGSGNADSSSELTSILQKYHASMFIYGSTSKKRPNCLTLGRTYNDELYDMYEFNVSDYVSIKEFIQFRKDAEKTEGELDEGESAVIAPSINSKPLVLFQNNFLFETSESNKNIKSMLADLFKGESNINLLGLNGIDRLVTITAVNNYDNDGPSAANGSGFLGGGNGEITVLVKHYAITTHKPSDPLLVDTSADGRILPRIKLHEIGPSFSIKVNRYRLPSDSLRKDAMRYVNYGKKENATSKPRPLTVAGSSTTNDNINNNVTNIRKGKNKNIRTTSTGTVIGRVHVGKQDYKGLHTPLLHKKRFGKASKGRAKDKSM